MPNEHFFSDKNWRHLLRRIHDRQVIPIVGPELITIPGKNGRLQPLYRAIAPKLAHALDLPFDETRHTTLNRVACDHLIRGGARNRIYDEVREIMDDLQSPVPQALVDLASITDFNLLISTSFDLLLASAVEHARPGFIAARNLLEYHYKKPVDIPEKFNGTLVYHLLGTYNSYPDFAVWSEDYLEFICGLHQHNDQLKRLFLQLRNCELLLLGAPFSDWVVRFFLRVAKGERFTDRKERDLHDYLADQPENLGEPMVFFFDKVAGSTRIISGNPADFTRELAVRWREKYSRDENEDPFANMPDEMPRHSVFISYSRDDITGVQQLVRGLKNANIPVWLDKHRLRAGDDYERRLEFAIKTGCSFFLSIISRSTESDKTRFVHIERDWAAQRHVDGFVYYIPVIIDDTAQPKNEPLEFSRIHFEQLPGGIVTAAFVKRLSALVDEFRTSGQPRA